MDGGKGLLEMGSYIHRYRGVEASQVVLREKEFTLASR